MLVPKVMLILLKVFFFCSNNFIIDDGIAVEREVIICEN
jgi:hypothetical protein